MAITFDGPNKIIQLDGATTQSLRAVYSRWVDWLLTGDNSKFLLAFTTIADPPAVPAYLTLVNGWLLKPLAGAYTLVLEDGFLYRGGGGDPLTSSGGVEPRIRYQNPVIAVGFSTSSPQQIDIDAIKAKTDQLTFSIAGLIDANVQRMNDATVIGDGTTGDGWRGVGVAP